MEYLIQKKKFVLDTIVLDLNGTLSVKGKIPPGVAPRLKKLKQQFRIFLLTGDQRNNAASLCKKLGIDFVHTHSSKEKEREMKKLGKHCVAIGNARIDKGMFKHAKLCIVTLQAEGIHASILQDADIIVPSILDALDILLQPASLIATMKE